MSTNTTTPQDAAQTLRKGGSLDVDVDVAVEAMAIAVSGLFRHVDPTATDGKRSLANFRMLADRAGLPHDHPVFLGWFALRALRPQKEDAVLCRTGCPVTSAFLESIGTREEEGGWTITSDARVEGAVIIGGEAMSEGETDAFTTPAGVIRIPGSQADNIRGDWASALTACDAVSGVIGVRGYDADPDAAIELAWSRPSRSGAVEADSIHEDWTPELAYHEDLRSHPSQLIQSATLATVEPPQATYRPRLTRRVIKSGRISDAQFEFLVAAGQAHSRHLPINPKIPGDVAKRVGIFLADGTGAGKTNEMLGIIMDNLLRGRHKSIIVLEKRRHLHGFVDAWASMGRDRRDFIRLWDMKPEDRITARRGILVMTYSMLRDLDTSTGEYIRVVQAAAWAGADFQGALLMDEAQAMRNAAGDEDHSGRGSDISQQGLAGIAIQDALPDARVVYASATGATDVHNLAYATRLGIWGPETPFETREVFISTFEQGNMGDLEQVTLSLKASGVYIARSISYEGVEVVHLPVTLTNEERSIYNATSEMWGRLLDAYRSNCASCGIPDDAEAISNLRQHKGLHGSVPYSSLNGIFEGNRKAIMATLIASFKARGVIVDAKRRIENGESVVIQMQNTYEAQLNRTLEKLDDPNDIRLEPAELVSFAEMLPIHEYELTDQPHPTKKDVKVRMFTVKMDRRGNPVVNGHASSLRTQMIEEAKRITLPLPPLDQIMLAFGPARMGEVTGRSQRLIPDMPNGDLDGATGVKVEKRTEEDRMADIDAFHEGTKHVLAFSTGAGGSSMSYHARIGTPAADRRRVQYLIQLGYRADEVTQGLGRTHRADQTMPPIACLVTVDLPADRLYGSRIVSALFKLGALTQGHRHATSNGMFDERDCLDGPYAALAWKALQEEIRDGLVKDYGWDRFMEDMGLNPAGQARVLSWGKSRFSYVLSNPNKLINRVAALTDRRQQLIFDRLRELIDKGIEKAMADGTFNSGPETLKATSLEVVTERRIETDRIHGGATRILRIRKKAEMETVSFGEAYKIYLRSKSRGTFANFCKHRTTGAVALIAPGEPIYNPYGDKMATNDIVTPTGTTNRPKRIVSREPWMPFADFDVLEGMWNAAVEAAPKETTSYVTIVADALLPVWPMLNMASGARTAVYRVQTDDGRQIVGRPISADRLPDFCGKLGIASTPDDAEIDDVVSHLKSGARVVLASSCRKSVHVLKGDWNDGRLTGASIELSTAECKSAAAALVAIPQAGTVRRPGSVCQIATNSRSIRKAVGTILGVCPAIFVEDGIDAKAARAKTSKRGSRPGNDDAAPRSKAA